MPVTPTPRPTVTVEQGPTWLAQFLVDPPGWVNPALQAVAALAIGVTVYRLYQRGWRLDLDTQVEMARVVAHVTAIMVVTRALVAWGGLPFLADVVAGVAGGMGSVFALAWLGRQSAWLTGGQSRREQLATVWGVLALAAVVLPAAVGIGAGSLLENARWWLVILAAGLTIYNARLVQNGHN